MKAKFELSQENNEGDINLQSVFFFPETLFADCCVLLPTHKSCLFLEGWLSLLDHIFIVLCLISDFLIPIERVFQGLFEGEVLA